MRYGLEIIQEYSTEDLEWYGYNLFVTKDVCMIKIHLGSLMDRKNMSFDKLVKKINSFFLLEYLCATLRSGGLWSEDTFDDGVDCNIKKTLKKLNYFLW